jgi:hypothetical protein
MNEGCGFFVRLVEQSLGEVDMCWGKWICVVFLFLCFVKLRNGVRNTGLCNLFGLRDLCHQI